MHTDVYQKTTTQMLLTVKWLKCVIFTKKYYPTTYWVTMSCSVATGFFVSPWIVASQAPQSVEFSRQEYWSGLPFPPPRDLPHPGIEPGSTCIAGRFSLSEPPGKLLCVYKYPFSFGFPSHFGHHGAQSRACCAI